MSLTSAYEEPTRDIIIGMQEMERAPELRRIAELPIEERPAALEELVELLELDLEKTRSAGDQVSSPIIG